MTKSQIANRKSQIAKSIYLILAVCHVSLVMCHWSFARAQDPPPDVRFGAVEAFRDPVAAADADVGWDRILFYWSELQPSGPDDWNGYHVPGDCWTWLPVPVERWRGSSSIPLPGPPMA